MNQRVVLISHAATPAMRQGRFPADDQLDARSIAEATASRERIRLPRDALALSSPAVCARETARALGLVARDVPELADLDYGDWRGRRLAELADEAPDELAAWTRDPDAAPHGGESFAKVLARVGAWLDAIDATGTVIAVTHAPIIRAALLHALDAPAASFARVEIAPLAVVELQRAPRGWSWWPGQHTST